MIGFDADGAFSIQPPPARKVADVTGAGDALAGATIAAMMQRSGLREALREGLAAAMLTVESPDRGRRISPHGNSPQRLPLCRDAGGMAWSAATFRRTDMTPETARPFIDVHAPVAEALAAGRPVVALESTIITHGMPYPDNAAMADERRKDHPRRRRGAGDDRRHRRPAEDRSVG